MRLAVSLFLTMHFACYEIYYLLRWFSFLHGVLTLFCHLNHIFDKGTHKLINLYGFY